MIRFNLACDQDHEFDAWFASSDEFETQGRRGLVTCPHCGSAKVEKSLMAPSVASSSSRDTVPMAALNKEHAELVAQMRKLRDHVVANAENVGSAFGEEARKMHYGETESRGIYGEANREEAVSLLEEGIPVAPLPVLPEDAN